MTDSDQTTERMLSDLDALVRLRREKGFPLEPHLRVSATDTVLDRAEAQLPFQIPPELRTLWKWHNGSEPDAPCLFRDQRFLTVAEAMEQRKTTRAVYQSLPAQALEGFGVDFDTLLPISELEGHLYAVCVGNHAWSERHPRPVISIGEGVDLMFHSVPSMLATVRDWYEVGVHEDYGVDVEQVQERTIWDQHNPGVFERST